MAGSYRHVVDDAGKLLDAAQVAGMLENGGDVAEAVEEMYGMIWWLADRLAVHSGVSSTVLVETARRSYVNGLAVSPAGGL